MINFGLVFQGGASMQLAMEISRDGEIDDISVNIQISPKAIDDHLSHKGKNHEIDIIMFSILSGTV